MPATDVNDYTEIFNEGFTEGVHETLKRIRDNFSYEIGPDLEEFIDNQLEDLE